MPTSQTRPSPAPLLKPDETVVLFDGVCKLCNGWARFLIRHDHQRRVRLAAVQSPEGQALLAWAGLPVDQFDSMAVIRDRHYWERSDAFFEVIGQLPARWQPLKLLHVFPRGLRDWVYDRIALNRYRLFGKYDTCLVPNPDHEARFVKMTTPPAAKPEN
ncbi:thiol-disulfide oxidoreductase DCC family protein [Pseudomonas baetica]|uniref:thiol-disulfide oxidoreductase DCC family protein n=1 Tax=Pseudomonas baetica TaxID=674054 RepID=UPI001C8CA8B9|nr:thiol-disulfide oxidoreductase DCC family protein [Pseudomonas baetica]MBX9408374.1 thiol-disulfide oxidoreductase DCC family protein [Pseudomonas baetica]